jgi:hypothetical protein
MTAPSIAGHGKAARPRFSASREVAERVVDRIMSFHPISSSEISWREYAVRQVKYALDAARDRGRQ